MPNKFIMKKSILLICRIYSPDETMLGWSLEQTWEQQTAKTDPVLYRHLQHHNDTIIKTQEDFFIKIFTSHFIARVRKGLLKVCMWEGAGDRIELKYFDPQTYGRHVVSFLFSWCSTGGPGVHSAGCWLSLLHLISNFSGPQTPSGFPSAPSAGFGFPYHISSPSDWNSNWHLTSVLTELYNSSTPTRSSTWSLKSHI